MPATIVGASSGLFTTAYENALNNRFFQGTTPPLVPGQRYLGLSTTAANMTGTVIEPAGLGYARVFLTRAAIIASPTESGYAVTVWSNAAAITFPTPTAAWPQVVSVFLADAATGGNVFWMANLSAPRTFAAGIVPSFAPGALVIAR